MGDAGADGSHRGGSGGGEPGRRYDLYGDAFDANRSPNRHLGFGKGVQDCMGAPVARLETEIALRTLPTNLPKLRVAVPDAELRYRFLPGFRALETLPVTWG